MSSRVQPAPGRDGRPRAKSNFSFRSNHSRKSSGSTNPIDLHESHEEKESKRLQSKANPVMALQEAEPSMVAREESSLAPIRAIQHLDNHGNPIADPDRSNPTRNRWERPLDTIRAFEAAIEGNYSRKSYIRSDSDIQSNYNRRSSYFGGTQVTSDERPRGYNSYQGGRTQLYRPDSYPEGRFYGMSKPDSYYQNMESSRPANGYQPNRARHPRTASEPHFNHNQGVYPTEGNQPSNETVGTASGSGYSDPEGYQTENSSIDRVAPLPVKEPSESYGFSSGSHYPTLASVQQEQQSGTNGLQQENGLPPQPPQKDSAVRVPIKLGKSNPNVNAGSSPASDPKKSAAGEKRRSWFGKRFSKG
ncbi:hypothetical protein PZA11_000591 [Diplocarpon coronariae]|uniref:DUF2406 domain-containing protein n=1 Tax=Diplocarpon coronariae TaxID=2795749 RepID=A0A218YUX0_9HELO|nr:hypothetical protein B2J93_2285 [Marssonina coronariae]